MKKTFANVFVKVWYIISAFIIIAAVFVSISSLLTPYFNNHRAEFEDWISNIIQYPVKIGDIEVTWHIYEPEINLNQITILDQKTHQPKLEIQRIRVDVGVLRSIQARQVVPSNVVLIGARLAIYHQPSGLINVQGVLGFNMKDTLTGASVQIDEFLKEILLQPRLALRDIDIFYYPSKGQVKWFNLHDLTLKNNGQHYLEGSVILHQEIPTTIKINFTWSGNIIDLPSVNADLYFYIEGVNLAQWFSKYSYRGFQVKQGLVTAKIWADWRNNAWERVQSSLQLYDLKLLSDINQKMETIERFRGDLNWKRDGDVHLITGEQIFIDFSNHLWPLTNFTVHLLQQTNGGYQLQAAHFDYLNLNDIKRFVELGALLPLDNQKKLNAINPRGELSNLNFVLRSNKMDLADASVTGKFTGLSVNSYKDFPALTNFSGEVDWDGAGGHLKLASNKAQFLVKQVFLNPIFLNKLDADINFQKDAAGVWTVQADPVHAVNADVEATTKMKMTFPLKSSPLIDLTADFSVNNAAHIANYLPLKQFDPELNTWLRTAFLKGEIPTAKAIVQGKLADFPFDTKPGNFVVDSVIKKVDLAYAPNWPLIKEATGKLVFSKNAMMIDINSGKILGASLDHVHGGIPALGGNAPQILTINGQLSGNLTQGMHFIRASPLEKKFGKNFAGLDLSGPMQLALWLSVPLKNPDNTQVKGKADLRDAALVVPAWRIKFNRINGKFEFTEKGVEAKNLQGLLFQEPAALQLTTLRDREGVGHIKADLSNKMSLKTLQTWLKIPATKILQGDAHYRTQIIFTTPDKNENSGTVVQIQSNLQGVTVDLPAPLGKKSADIKNLNITLETAADHISSAKINYANLLNANIHFENFEGVKTYVIKLENANLAGELIVPVDYHHQTIQGEFERCYFNSVNMLKGEKLDPKTLPPLDLTCQDLRYGTKELGRITFNAEPTAKSLQIKQLRLYSGLYTLSATGEWSLDQSKHYNSHLSGYLTTNRLSELLTSFGVSSKNLVANSADASFDLSWLDAPYQPTLDGMDGTVSMKIGQGVIVELSQETTAKMDLGRMLNIFSLSNIGRHLTTPTNQQGRKGFDFDAVSGTFALRDGSAYTQNTRINGSLARLDIKGRIGLLNKDYDLLLGVAAHVTGSLPLVATIAGGPVAGVAAWVVDKMLTSRSASTASYQYSITGTWDNPIWEKIDSTPER